MRFASLFAFALLFGTGATPAQAEKRVALVIGNSDYSNAPKLPNPSNDSEAMGILFRSAGFDVVEARQNLGGAEMRRAIRDFSDKTQDADVAVVFYAGHGIEVDGNNYLLPTNVKLERDIDVEDEAISLDRVLRVLEPAKRLRLVILDACRDNPFAKTMKRTFASRSVGRGLSKVEPATSDTLIAYSAKAGSTAADGDGLHSPFASALLKYLVTPGLDVRLAFGKVRDEVMQVTGNRQEPFVYGSLGGTVVTLAPSGKEDRSPPPDANAGIAREYDAASKLATREAWDAFLNAHPAGFYADLARSQRARMTAVTPPARPETDARPSLAPALEQGPRKQEVAEVTRKWGLIGPWSRDCSTNDTATAYEVASGGRVIYRRNIGDTTDESEIVSAEVSGDGMLNMRVNFPSLKQIREFGVVMLSDGSIRAMYNRNEKNEYTIKDGKFTSNGNPTPPQHRCK
jgi:hypothetical protein